MSSDSFTSSKTHVCICVCTRGAQLDGWLLPSYLPLSAFRLSHFCSWHLGEIVLCLPMWPLNGASDAHRLSSGLLSISSYLTFPPLCSVSAFGWFTSLEHRTGWDNCRAATFSHSHLFNAPLFQKALYELAVIHFVCSIFSLWTFCFIFQGHSLIPQCPEASSRRIWGDLMYPAGPSRRLSLKDT